MGKHALLAVLVLLCAGPAPVGAQSIAYGTRSAAGLTAHVITVNMADPKVKVGTVVAKGFPGTDEAFTSLVKRSGAVAAINGTFFDKYNLLPIGDIVSDGQVLREGRMGTAMAITPKNKVLFGRVTRGHSADWTGYETVLACGPTLVKGGRIDLRVSEEGFRDPHVLGAANRSAVGLTAENRLLLVCVTSGVTLSKLAQVMKALGCVEAMNLDGGGSMAMYYRGRAVLQAGRKLTNILAVYEKGKHLDLPEPVAQPEGNGSQPLSANAPRPSGEIVATLGSAAVLGPVPEWFVAYPDAEPQYEPSSLGAGYATADTVKQVAAFYRERFGKRADVQTTQVNESHIGVVYLLQGPGAGTEIILEREKGEERTRISVLFHQSGRPMRPRIKLPKPVDTVDFDRDTSECSVELMKPPAGVPLYPGTKSVALPDPKQRMYIAPASTQKVIAFYKAQFGDRARVTRNTQFPELGLAAVRVLSGAGAGSLVVTMANGPKAAILRFYKAPGGE